MPADRFFIPSALQVGESAILEDTEFHHLVRVMRSEEGDQVELVNGQGTLALASITQVGKKQAHLIIKKVTQEPKPEKELILAQALPRINRLDFIIEKGTELGATQFWLFPGHCSERKSLTEHQVERLQSLVIAAMKQCGRLYLPSIEIKSPLDQWEKSSIASYYGDIRETAKPFSGVLKPSESALFFIGPEAGFSDKEIDYLSKLGSMGVKLHPNILRTDTAALVALTIMSMI